MNREIIYCDNDSILDQIKHYEVNLSDKKQYIIYTYTDLILGEGTPNIDANDLVSLRIFDNGKELYVIRNGDQFTLRFIEDVDDHIETQSQIWRQNEIDSRGFKINLKDIMLPKAYKVKNVIEYDDKDGMATITDSFVTTFVFDKKEE